MSKRRIVITLPKGVKSQVDAMRASAWDAKVDAMAEGRMPPRAATFRSGKEYQRRGKHRPSWD